MLLSKAAETDDLAGGTREVEPHRISAVRFDNVTMVVLL
jgi:hypothetical protein